MTRYTAHGTPKRSRARGQPRTDQLDYTPPGQGACFDCGAPTDGKHVRCAAHHAKHLERSRARYRRKRAGA